MLGAAGGKVWSPTHYNRHNSKYVFSGDRLVHNSARLNVQMLPPLSADRPQNVLSDLATSTVLAGLGT